MTFPRIGGGAVALRTARAFAVLAGRSLLLGPATAAAWLRGERFDRDAWLADTVAALGPAFVKAAQLLSTRADILPPRTCRALSRLHDQVRPAPPRTLPPALRFGAGVPRLVGAGSIACVYRVDLPDGQAVAAKVRRPGIVRSLSADLAMLERGARVAARLPVLRGVPVTAVAAQLAESIRAQLDFGREAERLEGFRKALSVADGVTVPGVRPGLSTEDILVMDFLDGLARRRPEELGEAERRNAVVTALRAVYRMLFLDGVVHCDLHPGNLYFREDGSIVVLDAGFTVQLSEPAREKFAAFFYCMSQGDGEACADIVLSTAKAPPGSDTARFRADLAALVAEHTGRSAADFDLVSFAARLFDLQRGHGLHADPQFVFPILSLLVLEGTVREFHPDVDFQREARPMLVTALMERVVAVPQETR
ncbi:ABC1 kinase family protein [Amycolatopsis dendrobii]|uniref:AarF/ABC1/UbiB kinase family protein n=1 Tax=Amycolatopsis dendrobii TaxID=2760662 RepID=A0A7W3W3X6_9PSEU|nr:AarF/UbiB family protein [Amycolatopsis dendrobii]MBB1158305.1 AarF/ABC1/UbiB kinase family protein [Amycolatopsis dendrobii]